MYIPKKIKNIVNNISYTVSDVGKSGDTVLVFSNKYVLKISKDYESLKREFDKGTWLNKYSLTSKPIILIKRYNKHFYLKECLDGEPLFDNKYTSNPELLTNLIVEAFDKLKALDNKDCPFKSNDNIGNEFVHGDLCLPNILIKNNHVVGFIDLENSGLGDRWYDYAWVLWSVVRNTKTDAYNNMLLYKLNITFDEDKFNQYIDDELRLFLKTIIENK